MQFETDTPNLRRVSSGPMPTIDRTEFERLILEIEQDLLFQAQHLNALLAATDPTLAAQYRQKLQTVSARIKRPRGTTGVTAPG